MYQYTEMLTIEPASVVPNTTIYQAINRALPNFIYIILIAHLSVAMEFIEQLNSERSFCRDEKNRFKLSIHFMFI